MNFEGLSNDVGANGLMSLEHLNIAEGFEHLSELNHNHHHSAEDVTVNHLTNTELSIPQILHMVSCANTRA
jgi:hypothetical protein